MKKKWKRSKNRILIALFVMVLPSMNVFAGDTLLGTVKFGQNGVVSTPWIYSSEARFSHSPTVAIGPDVMYENTSNGTHWFTLETINSDYTRTFNTQQTVVIKLPSTLGGTFDDVVDSVVWSLTSSLDYGVRINGGSALTGSTYCTANINISDLSLIILGQEYGLNYQIDKNTGGSVYHDGTPNTYIDSPTKNLDIGSYVPFDLYNFHVINQWDVSIKITYDVNVNITTYDYASDYYVSTWTKWNLGQSNDKPLVFFIYSDAATQILYPSDNDKTQMDSFEQNSSSQSTQLGQLNQENKVDKIDINNASTTVDSNIDLNAVGSSGVVLSSLTGQQKILTMLLGVTAISLVAYVFFGKR